MFSSQTVVELVKALAKALLVGGVAVWVIWRYHDDMLGLMRGAFGGADARADHRRHLLRADRGLAGGDRRAGRALADLEPPEEAAHVQEDVRQEHKESEGDPRQGAHPPAAAPGRAPPHDGRRAQGGRGGDQPTHYAVALRYDESKSGAPRVLAKGTGLIAAKIRELAAEHKIPTLEAPPLARIASTRRAGTGNPGRAVYRGGRSAGVGVPVALVARWLGTEPTAPSACLCRPRWTRKPRPQLKESKE